MVLHISKNLILQPTYLQLNKEKTTTTRLTTMVTQRTRTQQKMFSDPLPFIFHGVLVGGGSMCPKLVKLVLWFFTETKQLHIYASNWPGWKFPCEVLQLILAYIWQMEMSGIYHSNVGKVASFHLILIIQFFKCFSK